MVYSVNAFSRVSLPPFVNRILDPPIKLISIDIGGSTGISRGTRRPPPGGGEFRKHTIWAKFSENYMKSKAPRMRVGAPSGKSLDPPLHRESAKLISLVVCHCSLCTRCFCRNYDLRLCFCALVTLIGIIWKTFSVLFPRTNVPH